MIVKTIHNKSEVTDNRHTDRSGQSKTVPVIYTEIAITVDSAELVGGSQESTMAQY